MAMNWDTFKTALGSFWDPSCIMYVDEEGSEVLIGSECEFQEALKVAKLNQNRLKLILLDKNVPNTQKMFMTFPESLRNFNVSKNNTDSPENIKMYSSSCDSNTKENKCHCSSDVPPVWFTHYMKKFKKDLLYELKLSIFEIMDCAIEKEQKPFYTKSDSIDFGENNVALLSPAATHTKKKKKISDKDGAEFSEQRCIKLPKKLEKLHSTKSERLEKLDNKTKFLLEEKKKLLERKRHSKSKLEKNSLGISEKKNLVKKSASFRENDVYIFLTPGGEFTVTVNIKNDGKLRWSSPRLECFDSVGLYSHESSISLPKLLPNETCFVTLRGKASNAIGLHHFKCRVIEEVDKIGPEFICWARVDFFEPFEKYYNVTVNPKALDAAAVQPGDPVDKLIDFDKDVIASSEKKIEENIIEIKKRLQYIDLLRPSTSAETNLKNNPGKTKNFLTKKLESETESCDLLQNPEEKEKNWTKRLEQEEVLFGLDCLGLASESNEACEMKTNTETDKNEEVGDFENIKKDRDLESSSDSELSVIFMSEEENFIVVPLASKCPSPAESVHEDKKCMNMDSEDEPVASKIEPEPTVFKEQSLKSEYENESQVQIDKEVSISENSDPNELSPTESRRSPFGEEVPAFEPKKMKSEYHFTAANLIQPTFTPRPDGSYTEKRSKFTFTGEKKGNSSADAFASTFTGEKEEKTQNSNLGKKPVPKIDASGRVIYAVHKVGYCVPVAELFENKSEPHDRRNENQHERRNNTFNEISSVDILPNVILNASNAALFAYKTAKSVINTLQSAFVTEGKTELGEPAYKDKKKVSMEKMFRLYEMGFSDFQINRQLLLLHDNDISKVIEELVRLEENSSKRHE